MPIGVLLAADGAVQRSAVGTLTPPGGVRYPSAWEQESATPLPRREPRPAQPDAAQSGNHSLPRRRDLRAPASRTDRTAGPRTPQSHPVSRPHFPATLPPGVVRLDEQDAADDAMPPHPFATEPTRPIARADRSSGFDPHATRMIGRPIRRTGPLTGSLDIDAELFTPASERATRQTPPGGLAARHTPSAGLSLEHLAPPPAALASSAPATPSTGVYPRRRDLRRSGAGPITGAVPLPPNAPPGLAFIPAQSRPAPCSGEIPLGGPLPRRRDLRNGVVAPMPTAEATETTDRPAGERNGAIAVGVARAAVMTMLVGVGYAVVSGHQLSIDTGSGDTASSDASAMMGAAPAGGQARAANTDWDVRGEVSQVKAAAAKQTEVRLAAAQSAASRIQAVKAAAAARAAQLTQATRDAQRDPKAVAKLLAAQRGWNSTQFTCLDLLWNKESGWNYRASNPSSGAYGIPQALPGSKMGSIAADWRVNPATQIQWGLNYIAGRYGTPCGAWSHSQATGWY